MWTLAPSLVATTEASWGEVRSLATAERWDVRPEDLPIVQALALGIADDQATRHRELEAAATRGWAVQAPSTADATIAGKLEALGKNFAWCNADTQLAARVLAAQATRRHMQRGFGQRTALPETVARRAALIGPESKDVLVLGDDDFMSVALVAAGHRVTAVVDADAIADLSRRASTATVIAHDLREPLPKELVRAFDAFITDPISGPGSLRLHLARGLASLKPDGYGLVCVGEASAQSLAMVTQELGAITTSHASDFNHYYDHTYELAPYVSDLVTVRASGHAFKPAPDEPYLTKHVRLEDTFFESASTSYGFKNINPDTCQLIHLDAVIQVLERAGRINVRNRSFNDDGIVRSYMVHTKEGAAIFIRVIPGALVGELFVAPADTKLEDALLAVLFGVLGVKGTVIQKRRVRASTLYTLT